jgi:hypothetical protein
LKGGGVEDFNELANRPLQAPASEITAGTGTSYRLFNVDNIKTLGAWAGIVGKPNQITNAEIAGSNINDIRLFSPNDVKAIVLTNAISTRASRLINPDNYASIAGALADEEVGNAIAGDCSAGSYL